MTALTAWDQYEDHQVSEDIGISSIKPDFRFAVAPHDPMSFVKNSAPAQHRERFLKFDRGTTTLAFRFQEGIMVACDSRASQGSFIASQTVRKIIEINDFLLGTMAGGAADCSFWERHLTRLCRVHELQNGERISVAHASKLLANVFYNYRGYGLSCGTMIAGYDVQKKDSALYMVDDSGSRVKGDLFSVGSGSTYAYGVLDEAWRWDLSKEDAHELARRAIYHAGHRDGASGGVVRVYWIHKQGWTKLTEADDIAALYDHYNA